MCRLPSASTYLLRDLVQVCRAESRNKAERSTDELVLIRVELL